MAVNYGKEGSQTKSNAIEVIQSKFCRAALGTRVAVVAVAACAELGQSSLKSQADHQIGLLGQSMQCRLGKTTPSCVSRSPRRSLCWWCTSQLPLNSFRTILVAHNLLDPWNNRDWVDTVRAENLALRLSDEAQSIQDSTSLTVYALLCHDHSFGTNVSQ